MKKNRKVSRKMSVNTAIATHFGAVIVVLVAVVFLNMLASSSCQHVMKAIGEEKKELARLENACNRETVRWNKMTTTENVERALLRHGLAMKAPRADQNVRLDNSGRPFRGQYAVRAMERRNGGRAAQYKRGR